LLPIKSSSTVFTFSIYDSKTHFVLRTLLRTIGQCASKKKCDKGLDGAVTGLVEDVETLPGQSASMKSQ